MGGVLYLVAANSISYNVSVLLGNGAGSFAAVAGYPHLTVPMGFDRGMPVGISFMGTAWSEPTLIKLASGFEAVTQARAAAMQAPADGADVLAREQIRDLDARIETGQMHSAVGADGQSAAADAIGVNFGTRGQIVYGAYVIPEHNTGPGDTCHV